MASATENITPSPLELLDANVITQVAQELNELEKKPVNGWSSLYPTLYATLDNLVGELCLSMGCPKPVIIITWNGLQSYQAAAHIMTDGSTQLHIGSAFFKKFVLTPTPNNALSMYRSFRWTIAHELAHLCDPAFKRFGSLYKIRHLADTLGYFWVGYGIGSFFLLGSTPFVSSTSLLISGIAFVSLKKLTIIILHHNFEYTADRIAMQSTDEFSYHDAQQALDIMTIDVRDALNYQPGLPTISPHASSGIGTIIKSGYLWFYKTLLQIKTFSLHPSISKRIQRLKKN